MFINKTSIKIYEFKKYLYVFEKSWNKSISNNDYSSKIHHYIIARYDEFQIFHDIDEKKNFFNLMYSRNFFNLRNTIVTFLTCDSRFFEKIKTLFKYIMQTISIKFFNVLLTCIWNVVETLINSKNIIKYSKCS